MCSSPRSCFRRREGDTTSTLLEPFGHTFFVYGVVMGVMSGALLGLIGTYVVLRGMSYIGHGLSHAVFGGAVASFVVNVNFFLGAGLWGFLSALMINRVARRRSIGADAAIGVITTASFAVGLALISATSGFTRNFEAALFGSILGIEVADLLVVAGVLLATVAFVFLGYRRLLFTTFDPEVAQASGVNVGRIDALFALIMAAAIVATLNVLGVTLMAAALVIPPVVARLFTNSFSRMLWLSVTFGALSGLIGMYASWYADISSGPAIVLTQAAMFIVAYAISGARGRIRLGPEARDAHA